MLRRSKLSFLFILSTAAFGASCDEYYAEEDCTPCCSVCSCSGSFGGGGGWLYLRPLITPVGYAREVMVESYENLTGTLIGSKDLCFPTEYESGFELFAFYRSPLGCEDLRWDIEGSFLSHRMKEKKQKSSISPRFFQPMVGLIPQAAVGQFSSVAASVETDFELLNGEFGGVIDREGSYFLRFFAGVQYANLKTKNSVKFTETYPPSTAPSASLTQIIERSRFHGIGPRVGIEGRIPLFCNISVIGNFASQFLFSKKSGSLTQESFIGDASSAAPLNDVRLNQKFCSGSLFIPGIEGKVGLDLRLNFWDCFSLQIEGGYRGLYYWDAVTHLEIISNRVSSSGQTALYTESPTFEKSLGFGLTGWFLGGSLQF